jgi:hypothetical protein
MIDKIGGRKVFVIIIATVVALGLVAWKGDIPPNFLTYLTAAVGFFITGNIFEHKYSSTAVSDTAEQIQQVKDGVALVQETLISAMKRGA